jgi:hypothetical protein
MHGRIIVLGVGNGGCVTVSGGEQGQRWGPNPPKQQTWVEKLALLQAFHNPGVEITTKCCDAQVKVRYSRMLLLFL